MAYAEKRGNLWRARWRGPDGTLESRPGFHTRKAAENYGRDQEAAIRANTYVDPHAGKITLTEWVNQWYPALDLEPTTLSNYRYQIEVHILPAFGNRALASITPEEVSAWERQIAATGYSRRTARDARSTLTTVLGDAIPRYIQANPGQRRRGKGRKGQRRIQRIEQAAKVWATPIQALLVAERCAALSGYDTDFAMIITVAYTGMRWSEVIGFGPECLHDDHIDVSWKLLRTERALLPRAAQGWLDPARRPAAVPGRDVGEPGKRARPEVHLPEYRETLVPGWSLRLPRPRAGPLPPVQLQRTVLPARCRRLPPSPRPAASDAGPGGHRGPVPGTADAAMADGRARPGIPATGRPGRRPPGQRHRDWPVRDVWSRVAAAAGRSRYLAYGGRWPLRGIGTSACQRPDPGV